MYNLQMCNWKDRISHPKEMTFLEWKIHHKQMNDIDAKTTHFKWTENPPKHLVLDFGWIFILCDQQRLRSACIPPSITGILVCPSLDSLKVVESTIDQRRLWSESPLVAQGLL